MSPENKKFYKELKALKKERNTMDPQIYRQKLRDLMLQIKASMANDMEVTYEEVEIITNVNKIINP